MEYNCCELNERGENHPLCRPLMIPDNDPFYGPHQRKCHHFIRSLAGHRPNCALGKYNNFTPLNTN